MDGLLSDLRFAARALLARPGFSALAVLTLAIGIGVNAVAFTALNGLLYKPSRFPGADTLGWITWRSPGNPHNQSSVAHYQHLARASTVFTSIAAEGRLPMSLLHDGRAEQVWALATSGNYFATLRATPSIGRVFTEADRDATQVPAVVSARFWQDRLGGDSIAGLTLTLNGRLVSVVGVLPEGFQGPGGFFEPDLWIPLDHLATLNVPPRLLNLDQPWLTVVGRINPGVTPAQATAELQSVASTLWVDRGETSPAPTLTYAPMTGGVPELRGIAAVAWIALAIVGLVLLIACFNVAALLLARAKDRQREIGVRTALGASRFRVIRQFAFEGLLLAVVSGAAALVVASWSSSLLAAFSLPSPIPQRLHLAVDWRLLLFTAALVTGAGILPALVPAIQATRTNLVSSMRMDALGGRRSRGRSALMVAQIAGSTLFLTTALLFVQSFRLQAGASPGFETDHVLVAELTPSDFGYDAARSRAFFEDLAGRTRALPGVEKVAIGDRIPFYVGFPKTTPVSADGTDCTTSTCRDVFVYGVEAGYMAALGVPILSGRELGASDVTAGDVVMVSQKLAARLWPDRPAVGEWIREGNAGRPLRVIGVVADITHHRFGEPTREYLYRALDDSEYAQRITMIVRTSGDPASSIAAVQHQVRSLDASLPPGAIKTMAQRLEMPLWPARTSAGFLAICGTLALALATIGLFGMTYLTVSQRTRELGIRAALGATPRRIVRLVLGEGLTVSMIGIAFGLVAAAIAARLLSFALVGVSAADPVTYVVSALFQASVATAACLLPARRATQVGPLVALRAE